ncbi:acyltransferase family protein [bacterium]|nr:acyltransferase family protein [bacterium]
MSNASRNHGHESVNRLRMKPDSQRPGQIREFEGLRGLLAVWVVFVHSILLSGMILQLNSGLPAALTRGLLQGQQGVALFMILSGFVVSMQLARPGATMGRFMTSRFFRIYPNYLLSLGLAVVTVFLMPGILETGHWFRDPHFESMHAVSFQERSHLHWHLLFHVFLIQAAIPNAWFPEAQWAILAPAWSLSHEWQFYLIAPRLRKAAFSPFGLMTIAVIAVVAARLAARLSLGLEWSILTTLPLFLIGILTYRIHERVVSRPEIKLSEAMMPLCGLTAFSILANWKFLPITAWTIVYGAVLAADRIDSTRCGAILACFSGLLKTRFFVWLGSISYALYLFHWPFMIIVLAAALKVRPDLTSVQAMALFVAFIPVMLWLCHLIHSSIGLPASAFGKRLRTEARQYPEPIAKSPTRAASTGLRP